MDLILVGLMLFLCPRYLFVKVILAFSYNMLERVSFEFVVVSAFYQELVERLGIYFVSFDRPGYGESDPNPKRTVKSMALDIEELADQLRLGSKFYVIGISMGGQVIWSCLKYIPHRYSILLPN